MAVEPSEDDIVTVVEITQTSREEAIRYLRVKNNPESAISAILDGEDIHAAETAKTWDDGLWQADREGAFAIGGHETVTAYDDANIHPLGASTNPTRTSSPAPKGGNEQEAGVVKDGRFGPATQSHYDPGQWAMTVSGTSNVHETREIVPDVDASQRRHREGEPRFLKQLPSGDYLPSFLTIAHAIPAAREALLMRSQLQPSYGQDADWWKGHAIRLPRIVSTDTGAPADPVAAQDEDLVSEAQRLMAFLDGSDRSYACIENLVLLASERAGDAAATETVMDRVLIAWETAARRLLGEAEDEPLLFSSLVGSSRPGSKQRHEVWSLPLAISDDDKRRPGELSLSNLMDNTLWSSDFNDDEVYDTFLEHCADVLPMRVTQDSRTTDNLGLIIPAEFFVDKYLKDNISSSRALRKEMVQARKRIAELENLHSSISGIPHPSGSGFIDVSELLRMTGGLLSGSSKDAVLADFEARGVALPNGALDLDGDQTAKNADIAARLQDIAEKITAKLAVLEEEKTKAGELLSRLSDSRPRDLEEVNLKHRYTLRGVATKPSVTYVLRRKPVKHSFGSGSDLMDLGSDAIRPPREEDDDDLFADPDAPPGWKWWRIEYDSLHAPGRIITVESTQDDVLRAVELEHSSALLVYASDRAMEHEENDVLPEPLAEFVQTDNKLFQQESEQQWTTSQGPRQGWDSTFGGVSVQNRSRRSSRGSTMVNYDLHNDHNEFMDDAPAYSLEDPTPYDFSREHAPPDWSRRSPDAHEIHLDEVEVEEDKEEDLMSFDPEPRSLVQTNRLSVAMSGMEGMDGSAEPKPDK